MLLYNILLLINRYSGNNAINAIVEAMSNNPNGYFIRLIYQILRSWHQPLSIASDVLDISNSHKYADICY